MVPAHGVQGGMEGAACVCCCIMYEGLSVGLFTRPETPQVRATQPTAKQACSFTVCECAQTFSQLAGGHSYTHLLYHQIVVGTCKVYIHRERYEA